MTRSTMKALWLCAVLALAALFCAVTVINSISVKAVAAPDPAQSETLPQEAAAPAFAQTESAFTLRSWNGRVGIFAAGKSEPLTVTDIELSTLRGADRHQLELGISASGYEEMLMLLEDLGS